VVIEILRRERFIGLTMIAASLGFALSLSLMNVDGFIVRQNVQRELSSLAEGNVQERPDLDAQYFLDLSDDAVPALVDAFTNASLPEAVREKIGAALVCKRYDRQSDGLLPWQSFHLSRVFADAAFADVNVILDTYELMENERSVEVETPGGVDFSCYPYYYD
jgi:hypothetical protein